MESSFTNFGDQSRQKMNFENVSRKHMNELELLVRELLTVIRKTKLENESLVESLRLFEEELAEARIKRFDSTNTEYHTY